jgi:hypothetical protein
LIETPEIKAVNVHRRLWPEMTCDFDRDKEREKTDILIENHENNDIIISSHLWPEVTSDLDRCKNREKLML